MSEYETDAYAYDPVRNEDVQITCHHADMPHNFNVVDAVATDDPHRNGDEVAQDNSRLVSTDLDHDPVEACQGSYTRIVDVDCPYCGYDRCDESVQTMAGMTSLTCRRCGASTHDGGDWSRPETERQRTNKEKEWSDEVGWMGNGSMFSKGDTPVYRKESGSFKRYWYEKHGDRKTVAPDDALEVMQIMLRDGAYDGDDCAELLEALVVKGDHFDHEAVSTLTRVFVGALLLPDEVEVDVTDELMDE